MTSDTLTVALYLLIAIIPSVVLHEYAHAVVAERLGDPTPRRWGKRTLDPRPHIDPFGSIILPGLLLLLLAVGKGVLPFAYAKPTPLEPSYLRHRDRDETLVALAGPLANLAIAAAAGLVLRVVSVGEPARFIRAVLVMNVILFVFNLMPIPGLDGARIVARFLHGRARDVYVNLHQYLPLFMLVIFFIFGAPVIAIVQALVTPICAGLAGGTCQI
ncbi:MAG: site-2 protease family protein [Actinomycetota bacterium]|nr:site-2 protease family protein [Actinomycetota bacterium]